MDELGGAIQGVGALVIVLAVFGVIFGATWLGIDALMRLMRRR